MIDLDYSRFVLALILVVGLIGLFAFFLRRMGFGGIKTTSGVRGHHRLTIQEVLSVDARRKLVLVRRDDKEHLVLLGITQDLLIESNIPLSGNNEPSITGAKQDNAFRRVMSDMLSRTK